MEIKKSLKANLEKGKTISFMMGFVVALAILFTAFEWGERDIKIDSNYKIKTLTGEPEPIDITTPDEPEPPKPEVIKNAETLVIVENEKEVKPYDLTPSEFGEKESQPVYVPIIEEEVEEIEPTEIPHFVEIMPEFPGGDLALLKWIAERINYPTVAAENGIDGLVSCSFIVNADGSISDVKILRSKDPLLDNEAVRVLKLMPNWKPGMQQGKNVRVKYTVPVRFKLKK